MKKITYLVASIISLTTLAQSQRTVLLEEFTQASCGPCAAANPKFNALVSSNSAKVVSIKYQTSWPGVDPMNAQNKSEIATRVSYYKVNAVPNVSADGKSVASPTGITQSSIDKEYDVKSPFQMELTQELNAKQDSIFVKCRITASQDFETIGPFYARFALVEKTIKFAKAPGSNGEKEFYSVMRKMLPSVSGSTLPLTWKNGHSEEITIRAAIPAYIYDKTQLSVIGFLQTDNDKVVQQAIESKTIVSDVADELKSDAGSAVVFPNPMTDAATISLQLFETKNVTLYVINALGQTILQNEAGKLNLGKQYIELNTSSLPTGFYFLNIRIGEQIITKKIAITR